MPGHNTTHFMIITALSLSGIWVSAETSPSDATQNRLLSVRSPYLRQHAFYPLDWFPWGDEAYEKAKAEVKVVLLSIGYSTCHWCHVMDRESFSNPKTADYLNEHFVCVEVDRSCVRKLCLPATRSITGSAKNNLLI